MFPPKEQTFVVTLQKQRQNIPWGISVVGGVDQGGPITITKVGVLVLHIVVEAVLPNIILLRGLFLCLPV